MLLPLCLSGAVAAAYVACIHVAVPHRLALLPRDHAEVIRFRVGRVLALCVVLGAVLPVWAVLCGDYPTWAAAVAGFGLVPKWAGVPWCLGLCGWLYSGPLAVYLLNSPQLLQDFKENYCAWTGFRNHVFAPISEEWVYRGCVFGLLLPYVLAGPLVVWSPFLFGLAHVHHGYTLWRAGVSGGTVAATTAFQLLYTLLFGMAAGQVYCKTGNLACAVLLHAACNLGGFPDFDFVETHPQWKAVYVLLLVSGLSGFVWMLVK